MMKNIGDVAVFKIEMLIAKSFFKAKNIDFVVVFILKLGQNANCF